MDYTYPCCLCFEEVAVPDLYVDEIGVTWDVCQACHDMEEAVRDVG